MKRLFLCLALVGFASPAFACINDEESPAHEEEFGSQYRDPPINPPPAPYPAPGGPVGRLIDEFASNWDSRPRTSTGAAAPGYWLLNGGGLILLTGAVTMALTGRRAKG